MSVTANSILAYIIPVDKHMLDYDTIEKYDVCYNDLDIGLLYDGMNGEYCYICKILARTETELDNAFLDAANKHLEMQSVTEEVSVKLNELSMKLLGFTQEPKLKLICHYT